MVNDAQLNEYQPDMVTPPGETLQDVLEGLGMTQAELAKRIGKTPKAISEIIKRGTEITPATAVDLEMALGIPASFWISRERRYRENLARRAERRRLAKWAGWAKKFPVRFMSKTGLIKHSDDKTDQVAELLRFFGIASPEHWEKIWFATDAAYRKSAVFNVNPEANSVWLRMGELQALRIDCKPFDRDTFRETLRKMLPFTAMEPARFRDRAVGACADAGVAVVFTPPIPGAPAYGVTRWLTQEKALVQLSLRGKWEDVLWFTFYHEAGHILLHGKRDVFVEGEQAGDEKETEANEFARDFLIPPPEYARLLALPYRNPQVIRKFASELGISPAIVVGRLQHDEKLGRDRMNTLRMRFSLTAREKTPSASI